MKNLTLHRILPPDRYWHMLLLTIMVLVGLLYGSLHLLAVAENHWNFRETIFFTCYISDDVHHYITQIKEIYERNYALSNSFLIEHKQGQSVWPRFPFYLTAFIGKALHLQVQHLVVLMDCVLPPLIFLASYWLLVTVSSVRRTSLMGALVLILLPHIMRLDLLASLTTRFSNVRNLVPSLFIQAHIFKFHGFSRTINPQLTYLFLLLALAAFVNAYRSRKPWYLGVSVVFGILLSYSYPFFSTYLYVCLGLITIGSLMLKNKSGCYQALLALGLIVACSLPFWYRIFTAPDSHLSQAHKMAHSHVPIINGQLTFSLMICAMLGLLWWKRIIEPFSGMMALALLLGGVICVEQHVISGIQVQPWHYLWYVIPQATIFTLALCGAGYVQKHPQRRLKSWLFTKVCLIGGLLLIGLGVLSTPSLVAAYLSSDGVLVPRIQALFTAIHLFGLIGGLLLLTVWGILHLFRCPAWSLHPTTLLISLVFGYVFIDLGVGRYQMYQEFLKPLYGYLQQLAPAANWLNQHTEKESVIVGGLEYSHTDSLIPIYTHNNLYMCEYAEYYAVPGCEELRDRLYNVLYLMGINSAETFDAFLTASKTEGKAAYLPGACSPSFEEYQKKLGADVLETLLTYRADYVFFGPMERKRFLINPERYPFLKPVYHDAFVTIYHILHPGEQ